MGRRPRATIARPAGTAPGPRAAPRRGASRPGTSRKGAVCGPRVVQTALFRHIAAREAWGATPRQPAGHYGKWLNWANASGQPPARLAGGCARARKPRPGTSRKSAVWAEGLAESARRARPGHHQAASCGLRRRRNSALLPWPSPRPPAPRAPCPASSGRWALTPGSPPSPRLSSEAPCPAPPTPLVPPSGADVVKTLIETGFRWPYEVNTG